MSKSSSLYTRLVMLRGCYSLALIICWGSMFGGLYALYNGWIGGFSWYNSFSWWHNLWNFVESEGFIAFAFTLGCGIAGWMSGNKVEELTKEMESLEK